jgi:hypothetical protein
MGDARRPLLERHGVPSAGSGRALQRRLSLHKPSVNEQTWFRGAESRLRQDQQAAEAHRREVADRRRLGEYLVGRGYLSEANLDLALTRQQVLALRGQKVLLGELLVQMRLAHPHQVEEALANQREDANRAPTAALA